MRAKKTTQSKPQVESIKRVDWQAWPTVWSRVIDVSAPVDVAILPLNLNASYNCAA